MNGMRIGDELRIVASGTGKSMIRDNSMASTVSHAENCLYDIASEITQKGSVEQKEALHNALAALEELYFILQEEE